MIGGELMKRGVNGSMVGAIILAVLSVAFLVIGCVGCSAL